MISDDSIILKCLRLCWEENSALALQPIPMRQASILRYYYCGNLLRHFYETNQLAIARTNLETGDNVFRDFFIIGRKGWLEDFHEVLRVVQSEAIRYEKGVRKGMRPRSKHLNDKVPDVYDGYDCPPMGECNDIGLEDANTPAWLFLHEEAPTLLIKEAEYVDFDELFARWFLSLGEFENPPKTWPSMNRITSEVMHPPMPKHMEMRVGDKFMPSLKGYRGPRKKRRATPEQKRYSFFDMIKL